MENKDEKTPITPQAFNNSGITLLDYFAGKVLQGIWSDSEINGSNEKFAKLAYDAAEAMLKHRETLNLDKPAVKF